MLYIIVSMLLGEFLEEPMKRSWKILTTKIVVIALLTLTLSVGLLAFKPSQVQAASCYSGAFNLPQITLAPGASRSTAIYQTSTNCNDINFRYRSESPTDYKALVDIRVCFHLSSGGISCNAWKHYEDFAWHTPATVVRDNTRYHLDFRSVAIETTITFNSQVAD